MSGFRSPMATPLVSVGIPVHNGQRTILRSLRSICGQDYRELEIVVVDNASTDNTADLVRSVAQTDPRIRLVCLSKNQGAFASFNRSVEESSGEFFLWVAADDAIASDYVSSAVRFLGDHPQLAMSAPRVTVFVDGRHEPVYEVRLTGFGTEVSRYRRFRRSIGRLPMVVMYGVYRTNALRRTALLTPGHMSDVAFLQEVVLRGPIQENFEQHLDYFMAERWKTTDEERRHFSTQGLSAVVPPFVPLLLERLRRIGRLEAGLVTRFGFSVLVVAAEILRVGARGLWRLTRVLLGRRLAEALGIWLYWRFQHIPDLVVLDHQAFRQRVVLPSMGLRASSEGARG